MRDRDVAEAERLEVRLAEGDDAVGVRPARQVLIEVGAGVAIEVLQRQLGLVPPLRTDAGNAKGGEALDGGRHISVDAGAIEVDGQAVRFHRPADAMRHGFGMVHQHFMLVDTLTVAENVVLGREPRSAAGALRRAAAEHEVATLAERHRLPVDPRARVGGLAVGVQQRVEILKALHHGSRVLILDEPTAVLAPHEVDELFQVLRALNAEGTTIVLITHKLAEVKAMADRVTVMNRGQVMAEGTPAEVQSNSEVRNVYFGQA